MLDLIRDPLNEDAPSTVPLKKTPLTGVLAQVRFPEILLVANPVFIAPPFRSEVQHR